MFSIPEQFSSATKLYFETQLAMMTALSNKAAQSVEQIVELNMSALKTSLEESAAAGKQILAAKDPQEFFSLSAASGQHSADQALAYGRELGRIATSVQAEFTQAAEAQVTDASQRVMRLVEEVGNTAPAGSENVVALVKSAIGNANASYEQFSKTTKQAIEAAEGNLNQAVSQYTQAAEKTRGRAKK